MQRRLNCLLDPITRLPVEISSEIFILCLPDSGPAGYRRPNPGDAPSLLLRICTAWADIARSTLTFGTPFISIFLTPRALNTSFILISLAGNGHIVRGANGES
ncbi:hypothetical protein C8J57DRAFT_1728395 [Mycena rebaudengoi]|nr:hypothetical protein C8J57DRAFT_1728395 [Mycena rebaudengoi]